MRPGCPTVIGVHSHRMPDSDIARIFIGWLRAYLHSSGLDFTAENVKPGTTELVRAYGLYEASPQSTRRLAISPDSIYFEEVLQVSPDSHNVITIQVDLTMAHLDCLRESILRIAYTPEPKSPIDLGDIHISGPLPRLYKSLPEPCHTCKLRHLGGVCPRRDGSA